MKMNKKFLFQSVLSLIAFLFLFGCAAKGTMELPSFSATAIDLGKYESKVDNFVVIVDASSSMRHADKSTVKFATAKGVADRLNMTLPELGQTAGMRSFGHADSVSRNLTELFYGMEKYSTAAMAEKMKMLKAPGGTSRLDAALAAGMTDLEGLAGAHNAVVIISDGLTDKSAVAQAQALKDKFGASICFYTVQVGAAADGAALLQEIAKIGGCGFASTADELLTSAGMAAFVQKAFLKEKAAPPAPAPAPAPKPERKDSDGDGVYDDEDQCPGTPAGAKVNAVGCWTLDHVLFDFDKSEIKPVAYPQLDDVIVILRKNPAMKVELRGHTDSIGTEKYNMGLSLRRANAVAKYLIGKGIAKERLTTTGFGFKKPVALNATEFGRSMNRRVELHP